MGSQSGQQMNHPAWDVQIIDTFDHSLNQALDFARTIPRLYREENLSLMEISRQLGISRALVRRILANQGITLEVKKGPSALRAQVPFGWRKLGGKLIPLTKEQKAIKQIKQWRKKGLSLHKIAERLSLSGVRTKNGGKWQAKTVSRILSRA